MKQDCNLGIHWRVFDRPCSDRHLLGRFAVLALALVILTSLAASGEDGKLARELKGRKDGQRVDVIVQFRVVPGTSHKARVLSHSGRINAELPLVDGLVVSLAANSAG